MSSGEEHTDVAALAAAVVAVAVSMFVVTGPYDTIGAIVALTLLFVIGAFIWPHSRTAFQSLAVAALFGVILIPLVGFGLELLVAHDSWSLLKDGEPLNCYSADDSEWVPCEPRRSEVNHFWHIGIWLVAGGLVFLADRYNQRRRRKAA